jgi:hypothetical protein
MALRKGNLILSIMIFLVSAASLLTLQSAIGQAKPTTLIQGNITAALNHEPFGGENIGTYSVILLGQKIGINIHLHRLPQPRYIFEARLVNARTNTSLSLGSLAGYNSLLLSENNISLLRYNLIIITQQAADMTDTKHSQPIGGAILRTPFGGNFLF